MDMEHVKAYLMHEASCETLLRVARGYSREWGIYDGLLEPFRGLDEFVSVTDPSPRDLIRISSELEGRDIDDIDLIAYDDSDNIRLFTEQEWEELVREDYIDDMVEWLGQAGYRDGADLELDALLSEKEERISLDEIVAQAKDAAAWDHGQMGPSNERCER